ncbi:porin [Bradyrhizobium embrapense]|uniref:porin n=1 Tax=Bradyrhizobium embrapense TaxID=630921 RepID=UPI00067A837E|nr:porin [Bradyrhizobium embrapense]
MKAMKRISLSLAAGLVGVSSAQAADLPVKAKAIEYVKGCSLYGPGFYYIPGTDTCIKLGGYLRTEVSVNSSYHYDVPNNSVGGARNRLSDAYNWRSREEMTIDTRTASEYGTVRTFFEGVFQWTGGAYSGAGNGSTVYASLGGVSAPNNANPGAVAGGTVGVWNAFIQFAGFTIGKAMSQFTTPWAHYPANVLDGLPGASSWDPVNQFSYTADFGQGISLSVSAQDSVIHDTTAIWNVSAASAAGILAGSYGGNDIAGSASPDFVGMLRVDQSWGLFQASVAAHDNHAAYYGATELTGHPSDKWGWAGQLALSIKNLPTGPGDSVNMSGVYSHGASRYSFHDYGSSTFAMYGGSGLPGVYQSLGFAGVSDAVFVAGSGMELTTTYGFQGGYTHNWNAYWNTGIFGGWAAVRYNGTAKGYMCSAVVANLALSSGMAGCNPDFSYSVVGINTRWTPVKNLTFTTELAYAMLDQKYASGSSVTAPLQAGIAKPAGTYEIKDQSAISLLFRAQRNW